MKTKLLLLFVIIFCLAGSCEPDEMDKQSNCNCEKTYYTKKVRLDGVQATFYYEKNYSEPVDCTDNSGQYIQIDSNKFYRIECE